MKVYRNTAEIVKKDRTGRRLSMTGLAILFIGLIASFVPTWYPPGTVPESALGQFLMDWWSIISFAALPLGFLAASFGSYYITRYARRRWPGSSQIGRPDEVLERSLKGLDDKYSLFIFSLPVSYVLLTPTSVLTFAVRSDKGKVRVNGDKWKESWGISRILTIFAREGVGHPPSELAEQGKKMQTYLSNVEAPVVPEGGKELEPIAIDGAVVFLNAETSLELTNPTVPVLRADQLKDFLRKRAKDPKPNAALMRAVAEYMQQNNLAVATEPATEAVAAAK